MHITVVGATGMIGARISAALEGRGHHVTRASRSTGVDVMNDVQLREAFQGAAVVVDCLNIETIRARTSREFFTNAARKVAAAAHSAGVQRIVCVSIAGATDPDVNRLFGYYKGKAAQEQTYRQSPVPVTVIHSTQWYELMDNIVRRSTVGPLTVLPTMKMAALAAERAAAIIAEDIDSSAADTADRNLAIRGPEVMTALQLCRAILAHRGNIGGYQPRLMVQLPYVGRGIATGGLIPDHGIVDNLTVERWLDSTEGTA
ncbi:SDR family oxidoreductase [Nesterenkonia haasae]|uniref:SDR family oxidoreductase n=1 Tax=Nesterenkonia haasae TaxID=2587813 RepID=UPI00139090DE|nr:NAD(P)H-binding protein [Nesterenkonia haasae]NDK31274.1 NAD-dependent epimerase/dehydratase family protein [Nesterenkonia haasae]